MNYCKTCGNFIFINHKCPPCWNVCWAELKDDEDEYSQIYAWEPDEAAAIFVEKNDDGEEPSCVDVVVFVEGKHVLYEVEPEYSVDYYAREKPWPSEKD